MSLRFVVGLAALVGVVAIVGFGGSLLRRRVLPGWQGAPGVLVDVILSLSVVLVGAELLGTVGLFTPLPLVLLYGIAGAGMAWIGTAGRSADSPVSVLPGYHADRVSLLVAGGLVVALVAGWMARIAGALHLGMGHGESHRYHMPKAIRFAQDGSTFTSLHVDPSVGTLVAYYPDGSELLHGVGIVMLRSDVLSHLVNLGFVGLLLLAAWCLGRCAGVGPAAMAGAAVVVGTPHATEFFAGNGANDLIGTACVMASLAVFAVAQRDERAESRAVALLVVGLAAGLAISTKYLFVPPVAVLGGAVIVMAPRGARIRSAAWFALGVGVTGSYWFLRNLVIAGNPVPPMDLTLGPLGFERIPDPLFTFPLTDVILVRQAWTDWLGPGLEQTLGPLWWLLLGGAVIILITAVVTGPAYVRVGAAVGIATFVGYLLTPQALGPDATELVSFHFNVRYVLLTPFVALVILPGLPRIRPRARLVIAFYAVIFAVTQIASGLWRRTAEMDGPATFWSLVAFGLFVVLGGLLLAAWRNPATAVRGVVGLCAVALLALVLCTQAVLLDGRHEAIRSTSAAEEWAWNAQDRRIAVAGTGLTYRFHGADLSNHVQFLLAEEAGGRLVLIEDCRRFREELNAGDYTHLVTVNFFGLVQQPILAHFWAVADPAAEVVADDGLNTVVALHGDLDPQGCTDDITRQ